MLKINVIFFIILKLVNTYKQYYMDLSSGDFDDKIYPFTQTISEFPNEGIEIHIIILFSIIIFPIPKDVQ